MASIFERKFNYAALLTKTDESHASNIIYDNKLVGFMGYPVAIRFADIYKLNPFTTFRFKG
jgi:hypothetical protein